MNEGDKRATQAAKAPYVWCVQVCVHMRVYVENAVGRGALRSVLCVRAVIISFKQRRWAMGLGTGRRVERRRLERQKQGAAGRKGPHPLKGAAARTTATARSRPRGCS